MPTASSMIMETPPSRPGGGGSLKRVEREATSFSTRVSVSVARYSAACGVARVSERPSRVERRQLEILARRASFSSSEGVGGAKRRRFFSMILSWAEKVGSRPGWK